MAYSVRTKDGIVVDNIPDHVSPDDPSVKQRVQRARIKLQIENDPITKGAKNFNEDSGFFSNALAGAGKALSDTGLGIRQLTGFASQEEVDERSRLDRPLMSTAGGITGNIGTQIGMALLPGGVMS